MISTKKHKGKRKKKNKKLILASTTLTLLSLLLFTIYFMTIFNNKPNKLINKVINNETQKELTIFDTNSTERPIAIMIDNNVGNNNHAGLQESYLNYEIIVEGGLTRIMAIYKDRKVELIGPVGFIEDDNGKVSSTKPTSTEKALDENNDASFVTISFGTGNLGTTQVSKSILEGLARYVYYISNYDTGSDLIYRANSNDKLEEVAKYYNSDPKSLKSFNKFKNDRFIDSQTVINPSVEKIDAFNKDFEITISMSSKKSY